MAPTRWSTGSTFRMRSWANDRAALCPVHHRGGPVLAWKALALLAQLAAALLGLLLAGCHEAGDRALFGD